MRRKKVYIHYGSSRFDPNHSLGGGHCGKPNGLWASPRYSKWGWVHWCKNEEYHPERLNKHFKFRLKKGTRILEIRCLKDVAPYLIDDDTGLDLSLSFDLTSGKKLDIEKIKKEFDGMEIFMEQNWGEMHNSMMFYSYDVDSLVIWNLDKVIQV